MKSILLDTHILLWWLANDSRLTTKVKKIIASPDNKIYVSSVSIWEASIKRALGRLEFDDDKLLKVIETGGFQEITITMQHGLVAGNLPRHHEDPFDRMLIAQTKVNNLTIITHDKQFQHYDISIIWA
ncbi:type II toxin-antitoxin system VapC family toxin [Candidatus Halobeggiatoa sp. HSG11]|nr:type II toxin-antitoxin system VapC family toxin [Candidatus Halobeggiatoa sp. HSG11]